MLENLVNQIILTTINFNNYLYSQQLFSFAKLWRQFQALNRQVRLGILIGGVGVFIGIVACVIALIYAYKDIKKHGWK